MLFALYAGGIGLTLCGLVAGVVFAGSWVVFGSIGMLGSPDGAVRYAWIPSALLALAAVALLSRRNIRLTREHLMRHQPRSERTLGVAASRRRWPAFGTMHAYPGAERLGPDDFLLAGPRYLTMAWGHIRRAGFLMRMDQRAAGRVLACLLARPVRVPFSVLAERAALQHPVRTLLDLRELPGVIFLSEEPSGMTLSDATRTDLADAAGPKWVLPAELGEEERNLAALQTLHEILGLRFSARTARVSSAVDRRVRECGSAETGSYGAAFQRMAADHVDKVQRAYEDYRESQGGGPADPGRIWEEQQRKARKNHEVG
jgi:hypothetical protein